MKRVKSKLRSHLAMTLTEVLVALLIFSLVSVGMVAGINGAITAYSSTLRSSEAQTLCNTLSEAMLDIVRSSDNPVDGNDATGASPRLTNAIYGENVSFASDNGMITLGGKSILGSGAYTNLNAAVSCACSDRIFTINLIISDNIGTLADESFSVRVGRG